MSRPPTKQERRARQLRHGLSGIRIEVARLRGIVLRGDLDLDDVLALRVEVAHVLVECADFFRALGQERRRGLAAEVRQ